MFKNLKLKLLALLIGTVFWAGVVSINNNVRTYAGSLEIKPFNLEENLLIANELEQVRLRLVAPNEVFANLTDTDFDVYVDLDGMGAGEHTVPIKVTPKNNKINIARIMPDTILVALAPQAQKTVPVAVQIKGNPAPNFTVKEAVVSLKEVEVIGPESLLNNASQAIALVELSGEEIVDVVKNVPLHVVDNNGNNLNRLKTSLSHTEAKITLTQILKTKTVGIRAHLINDLPDQNLWVKKVTISPPTVIIKGDFNILQGIDYLETVPIDLSGVRSNFLRRYELVFPDRIEPETDTKSVLIKIELGQ